MDCCQEGPGCRPLRPLGAQLVDAHRLSVQLARQSGGRCLHGGTIAFSVGTSPSEDVNVAGLLCRDDQLEPSCLPRRAGIRAPPCGQCNDEEQAAPMLVRGRGLRRSYRGGVGISDFHAEPLPGPPYTHHVCGLRVRARVRDQLSSERLQDMGQFFVQGRPELLSTVHNMVPCCCTASSRAGPLWGYVTPL